MEDLQKLSLESPLVELYTLDCTAIGGSVYRFTPNFENGGSISFGGLTYTSMPIISDGWEANSNGTQPRPTLTISNVNQTLLNAVITLGDIVGAKVTRMRTLAKYLDGGSSPDSNQFLQPEIFFIDQKVSHDKVAIAWQLSSILDRFGTKIPRRQITKDTFPGVGRQRGAW